jgi:hypothetical protein
MQTIPMPKGCPHHLPIWLKTRKTASIMCGIISITSDITTRMKKGCSRMMILWQDLIVEMVEGNARQRIK